MNSRPGRYSVGNVIVNVSIVCVTVFTIEVDERFSSCPEVPTAPSIRDTAATEASAPASVTAASNRNHPAVPVAAATPVHVCDASFESTPATDGYVHRRPFTAVTPPAIFDAEPNEIVVPVPAGTHVFTRAPRPGFAVSVITPDAPVVDAVTYTFAGLLLIAAATSVAVPATVPSDATAPPMNSMLFSV